MDVAVPVGGFTSDQRRSGNRASGQLDWTHPIGKTRILSLGGQFSEVDDIRRYRLDPDGGPGFADRFDPKTFYWAAYATYQQRFGSLTLMPGLRLETMRRDPSSPGQARLKTRQTDLFPTLHIDHPLAKGLDLSVSYSKRIDRADLESLRPYPVVIGIQSVLLGNPKLRDQSTDVYEANLHFHRGKLDLGLIAYDREIKHVWGSAYDVNAAGMSVTTTRNTGRESDRGAELDISSPLFRRIKTNASFNLFDSRVPVDFGSGTRRAERFRYTGNATIEYDDAQKHGRPGDIGQLQLLYDGPRRDYQIRYRGSFSASLSYTRSLTRTLALTGSAEGIGQSDNRHRLEAPLVQEYYSRRDALPLFKLKLVKTFSGAR
jgi:outer membrane receptor for Fe3+-dicitrate